MSGHEIAQANRDGGAQALAKSARTTGTDDRPFAILRYAKLKSTAAIRGSSAHMRRSIRTPNADPALTNSNDVLTGSANPVDDVLAQLPELGARNEDGHLLRRKNSVLAVEVLMTTSPEWFATATPDQIDAWVARSRAWLAEEWGADNVVHLELHRDETTPHLTGFIVPLDPDTGALNARRWIGGRASRADPGSSLLSGHQTRYAEAVEDLGLRRGRLGSTATHTELREYQRRVGVVMRDELQSPEIGTPPLVGREAWAAERQAEVLEALKTLAVGAAEARTERGKAQAAGSQLDRTQTALDEAKAARRALADSMRQIPIDRVLVDLGAEWDKIDQRWKIGPQGARDHRIEIEGQDKSGIGTGPKWRCAVLQSGGRGAIDLVRAVTGADFNGALSWLADRYGTSEAAADVSARYAERAAARVERAVAERPAFTPPQPDPEAWPSVRAYLVGERGIDGDLIDAAHEAGDVYAQTREGPHGAPLVNAIFLARDAEGVPTGAEIKGLHRRDDGTRYSGMAAGSNKRKGSFRVGAELAAARVVIAVEAAIDAMSAYMFARSKGRDAGVCVVSTAGDAKEGLPDPLRNALRPGVRRLAAQDRGTAGDRQARRLQRADPDAEWQRWLPPKPHGDWNDWAQAYAADRRDSDSASDVRPNDPFNDIVTSSPGGP